MKPTQMIAATGTAMALLVTAQGASAAILCPSALTSSQSAPLLGDDVKIGCPLRVAAPRSIHLSVRVRKFCVADFPFAHRQVEFKLKIQVKNLGGANLDIRAYHWRLLVSRMNPDRWHAPGHGGAVGIPNRVSYGRYRVWSVPANANGSFDSDASGEATFASFWDGADLASGATYYRPANRQGDLAFYVPRRYVSMSHNVIGLAYVAGGRARVVAHYRHWRGRTDEDDF